MANKKKLPARALACLLSTAMVPGSLPMDVLTVYGAEAEEFSDGQTSDADIAPLDADAVDDTVATADFSSGSEGTAAVVSEDASVDVQSVDPNFDYTLDETAKTHKVGDTGSATGTAVLDGKAVTATVTYASSNQAVVAVDPVTGFYNCLAEGTAAITATAEYADANAYSGTKTYRVVKTLNITVTKDAEPQLTVTVKHPNVSVELDAKADAVAVYDLMDNVSLENAKQVQYRLTDATTGNSADASAASISGTGLITFKKAGKYIATVTAVSAQGATRSDNVIFDVTKKTSAAEDFTYEISELQRTHTVGESGSAVGTAFLGSQAVQAGVGYTSSDDTVVKVETDGTYKCLKAGKATVKVSATYHDTETGKSYARTINLVITVKDVDAPVVAKPELTASKTDISLELDAADDATVSYNLKSILSVVNADMADVKYQSSDKTNAAVTEGVVTFKKAGEYTLQASVTTVGGSSTVSVTFHITKKGIAAPTITADQTDVNIELETTENTRSYDFKSILNLTDATFNNVTYASSDNTNAAVGDTGVIAIRNAGEYTVKATVTTPGGSQSVSVTFHVTRKGYAAPSITTSKKDVDIELGVAETEKEYNLKSILSLTDADWAKVTYESSDIANAAVDADGKVTVKAAGEYTVKATVTTEGGSQSVTVTFHVTKAGIAAPTITANQTDVDINLGAEEDSRVYNLKSILNLTDADWTTDVELQSSDATNAVVDSTAGTVTVKAAGEYTVKATVTTTGGSQSVTVTFHVTKEAAAKPVIAAKQKEVNITLASGKTVAYNLKANFTLSNLDWADVDLQSSDSTNAVIDPAAGTVTFSKVGYYTVSAVEKTNNAASETIIFHVTSAVQEAGASITGGQLVPLTEIGEAFDADASLVVKDFDGTELEHGSAGVVWASDNEAVATVTDGVIVAVSEGTAVVTATLPNGNYTTYTVVVAPVQISAEVTSFDVDLNDQNLSPEDYDLSTLITSKNAGALKTVYSDFNRNIINVDDNGHVTFVGATGTTYVRAQVEGTDAYVIITFNVTDSSTPDPITINYAANAQQNIEVKEGQAYEKSLRDFIEVKQGSDFADLTNVTWSSNDDSIAKVDDGIVTGVKAGTAVISATTTDGYYVTFTVNVKAAMKLNATQTSFAVDKNVNTTADLKAYLNIENPEKDPATGDEYTLDDVVYTTSSDEIANVAADGTVTFVKAGLAQVKAELNGQVVTFTFHITDSTAPDPITINYAANAQQNIEVKEGQAYEKSLRDFIEVKQGGDFADLTNVIWSSNDDSIAKVDNGIVTGVKAGTAVISATTVDGYYVTFIVDVKAAMKLNATQTSFEIDMKDNTTLDLKAYLNIENPEKDPLTGDEYTLDDVVYTTSSDEIATVATDGTVTFVKPGVAQVKAELNGQVVTFTFIVKDTTAPAPVEINIKPSVTDTTVKVLEGEVYDTNLRDMVEVTGGDIRDITWTSFDDSVATVSNGMVKGVKAGETTVVASTKDGYFVTFKVIVTAAAKLEASQTEFDIDRAEQASLDLKAYLKLLNTTDDLTSVVYTASADEIAEVDTDGIVTFNGTGTTNVKAEYDGQVITFTFHITDSTTPDPVKIDYAANAQKQIEVTEGEAYAPSLTEYIELTKGGAPADLTDVTWSSNDDSIAKVDGGIVTGVKAGTAVITATTVDGYYVTFTVKVNPKALADVVLKAAGTNVINLTLDSAANASKDLSDLVESTTVAGADVKGFAWSSDNTDVAVVANGTVKAVNPGLATVTVTAPDGSSVSFIVTVSAGGFDESTLTQENLKQIILQLNTKDKETAALPAIKSVGGTVTWTVLDTDVARIAGNKVEGLKAGHTVAVATAPDGSSVGVSVKVLAEPEVTVRRKTADGEIALKMGQKETYDLAQDIEVKLTGGLADPGLNPGGDPAVDTDALLSQITWTSSDESVVKVYSGVAVAKSAGVAVVTATAPDGSMAVFTITVDKEDISGVQLKAGESNIVNLILDGSDDESHKDLAKLVEDTVMGADPATFDWVSADENIATVSHGVVRAQAVGNTTVTVTAPDGSKVVFIVAVSAGGFKPGYQADWEAVLQLGVQDKMSKKLPDVEATAGKVTWSSADESIAKITGDSVTAVAPGVTYVIVKAPNGSELAFKVTVYASPAITFDKDSVSVPTGEAVQANVTVDPEDAAVDYSVTLDGNPAVNGTDYTLTVNGKKISFVPLAAGRFVITATADVNGEKATAQLVVTAQQEVTKVEFTEDKRNLFVGDTDDLLSLIKWNEGLSTPYDTSLTWSTGNASVATVDDTGVVTATGVGSTYVYAKASNGLRAKILVIVDAKVEGVTLSQEEYELWVNESAFIKATPNPANAKYTKIEYTSDDDTIATVDTEGRIVAKKGGTTYIKATITWTDGEGVSQTASARAKVFVKTPVESVEVRRVDTDSNDTIYAKKRGETIQLKAVITPAEAYDKTLAWSSENEAVATVDQNGKVTTVGKGTTYIYAKCMNGTYGTDGNGTPAVGMIKIVVGAEEDIQLSITPNRSEVYPGENVEYKTTLTPEEAYAGQITWSSDNPDVVIDSTGVAMVSKTAKAGLANITATMTFADGSTTEAKALLYIKTDVTSLKFAKDAMTIYLDEDDYLSPIFNDGASTPSDTSLTWTSDDSSIVSVDSYGKIHANKLGTTWISVYSYNKLRAQMLVKVIAAPTGIKLSEEVISGFAGEKHDISYTFTPDYTTETGVTWSTNNADVAYYDTYTNKIVMKGAGSCWITITANDTHNGTITDKVKVNVRQKVTGVTISAKKLTKKVGNMFKMTATAIPANGVGSTIFWTSSRPQVATVDEFGVVTCLKPGTTMITAITANGHVAKCYLRVKPGKKAYTVKYGVTTANALFVRNSASLQGVQIGQLSKGTAVTIVDTVDEWYKIKFNGGYGYVRSSYVSITKSALTKRTAVKSNGQISTTTWIYTGVGTGANTVAPVATRVLITGETGNYYRVRYGTGSVGSGYVLKSCVTPDAGFKYGVATKTTYLGTGTASKKVSSTPQVTVYRVARTRKRTGVYSDATGKGKRIGVIQCKAKVVLNSAKINGYYQVVFTNGVTGYVPVSALKLLGAGVKSHVNTTNTYTKAYSK